MTITFKDYTRLIQRDYECKRKSDLSLTLSQPTSAKLRDECLRLISERFSPDDRRAISSFFGPGDNAQYYKSVIGNIDPDKFKPLTNFLKGLTENTEDKNVELLAWLIDFKHRPYVFGKDFRLREEELHFIQHQDGESSADMAPNGEEETQQVKKESASVNDLSQNIADIGGVDSGEVAAIKNYINRKAVLVGTILISFVAFSAYLFFERKNSSENELKAGQGCMIWSDDRYVSIPCAKRNNDPFIVPLNAEKMRNFRRITQPDTLTEYSINQLFYIKDHDSLFYYNTGGFYPLDPKRRLKKISHYIFDKYLSGNKNHTVLSTQ